MGLLIAHTTILRWAVHHIYLLVFIQVPFTSPWMLVQIAVQTYFYTGLFITAQALVAVLPD